MRQSLHLRPTASIRRSIAALLPGPMRTSVSQSSHLVAHCLPRFNVMGTWYSGNPMFLLSNLVRRCCRVGCWSVDTLLPSVGRAQPLTVIGVCELHSSPTPAVNSVILV